MYLMAMSNMGGGQGGMGGFDPTMLWDPRTRMKMNLGQSLIQQGMQTGPVATPLGALSRLGSALTGGMMMKDLIGGQGQQDPQAAAQMKAENDRFGELLGAPGTRQRNWWESMTDFEKQYTRLSKGPEILATYGTTTGQQQQGNMPVGELQQQIQFYNKTKDQMTPLQRQQTFQQLNGELYAKGWAYGSDQQGNITFTPVGETTPGYKATSAAATAAGTKAGEAPFEIMDVPVWNQQANNGQGGWETQKHPKSWVLQNIGGGLISQNWIDANQGALYGSVPSAQGGGSAASAPGSAASAPAPGTPPAAPGGQMTVQPLPPPGAPASTPTAGTTTPAPKTGLYDRYGLGRPSTDPTVVDQALRGIALRESGYDGTNFGPKTNRHSLLNEDSTGIFQFGGSTWKEYGPQDPRTGKPLYATAMDAPEAVQWDAARRLYHDRGELPWLGSNQAYRSIHPIGGGAPPAVAQGGPQQPLQVPVPVNKNVPPITGPGQISPADQAEINAEPMPTTRTPLTPAQTAPAVAPTQTAAAQPPKTAPAQPATPQQPETPVQGTITPYKPGTIPGEAVPAAQRFQPTGPMNVAIEDPNNTSKRLADNTRNQAGYGNAQAAQQQRAFATEVRMLAQEAGTMGPTTEWRGKVAAFLKQWNPNMSEDDVKKITESAPDALEALQKVEFQFASQGAQQGGISTEAVLGQYTSTFPHITSMPGALDFFSNGQTMQRRRDEDINASQSTWADNRESESRATGRYKSLTDPIDTGGGNNENFNTWFDRTHSAETYAKVGELMTNPKNMPSDWNPWNTIPKDQQAFAISLLDRELKANPQASAWVPRKVYNYLQGLPPPPAGQADQLTILHY